MVARGAAASGLCSPRGYQKGTTVSRRASAPIPATGERSCAFVRAVRRAPSCERGFDSRPDHGRRVSAPTGSRTLMGVSCRLRGAGHAPPIPVGPRAPLEVRPTGERFSSARATRFDGAPSKRHARAGADHAPWSSRTIYGARARGGCAAPEWGLCASKGACYSQRPPVIDRVSEAWPSGLRRRLAKPLMGQPIRRFESCRLR